MEELMIVANVAIVFGTIYKLFELFVGKKERQMLIDKLSDNSLSEGKFKGFISSSPYSALRIGGLLFGLGFGMLMGYIIINNYFSLYWEDDVNRQVRETASIIYGASTLFGGGLGVIVAFLIEVFCTRNSK